MTAIREQLLTIIFTRLAAIPGVQQAERMFSGDPSAFPALIQMDGDQTTIEEEAGTTRYAMEPTIEGYIETADGASAAAALNELYAAVIEALVTDPVLDGLGETIDEKDLRVSVATLAGARRLGFLLSMSITYATRRGNPALQ